MSKKKITSEWTNPEKKKNEAISQEKPMARSTELKIVSTIPNQSIKKTDESDISIEEALKKDEAHHDTKVTDGKSSAEVSKPKVVVGQETSENGVFNIKPSKTILPGGKVSESKWGFEETEAGFFTPFKYVKPKKSNVIILVIENSLKANAYSKAISGVINKIVEDNKSSLFILARTGADRTFFEIQSYDQIKESKLLERILTSPTSDVEVKLSDAFGYIESFFDMLYSERKIMTLGEQKYEIIEVSIACLGSGASDDDANSKQKISSFINNYKSNILVKAIKYFCVEDKDMLRPALLGFPVIGHIETNFYK